MAQLKVLCPQEYEGIEMKVTGCTRCDNWNGTICTVETGAEHLPLVPARYVPSCPLEAQCQHQLQANPGLCAVRARGLICESALVFSGMSETDAADHPLSFHAMTIIPPEELEAEPWRGLPWEGTVK